LACVHVVGAPPALDVVLLDEEVDGQTVAEQALLQQWPLQQFVSLTQKLPVCRQSGPHTLLLHTSPPQHWPLLVHAAPAATQQRPPVHSVPPQQSALV
jgi:hypothetical protein